MTLPKACPSCFQRYSAEALYCAFDGSPLAGSPAITAGVAATDPYIGHEIVGPIEIRQLVGIGAMGRVYRGFQKGIDRDVAVKILHRELSSSPTIVARFHREAKVASRLAHPHVVQVLLTGQLPDGAMYIVMEYLDGMSLQSALAAAGGAMPLRRALHITLALCAAAGEAHAQGIVHRDLKPENVMLVNRADDPDFVKVLDFGIARLNWGDPSMGSAAGLIFGTARYISPEGAQGEIVGPPGDVYAIATMFYQMLAGRTPFDAGQAVGLLVHQIHDPAPPLKSIAPASLVPEPIAAAVMKNLAKKPGERSQNAQEFGRVLFDAAVAGGLSPHDILTGGARPVPRFLTPSRASTTTEIAEPASFEPVDATMDEKRQPTAASSAHPLRPSAFAADPGAQTYRPSRPPYVETTPGKSPKVAWLSGRALPLATSVLVMAAIGAAGVASRTAWQHVAPPQIDAFVSRANSALLRQHWDAPADDNVRDITDDGLSRWPNEPQLLRIRTLACNDIVKLARAKRDEGSIAEALRLARLAYRLDPSDDLAQKLAAEMESQAQSPPADSVPPLAVARSAAASAFAKAALETSNPKPSVGQPVDFSARVIVSTATSARAKIEGASFRVSGPGVAAGTQLVVADGGSGVFRTTYAFSQEGRFEVVFTARVDGAPLRVGRVVQVGPEGESRGTPAAPPDGDAPAPAPASTGKWL